MSIVIAVVVLVFFLPINKKHLEFSTNIRNPLYNDPGFIILGVRQKGDGEGRE